MIRVLLVDDHPVVRRGLSAVLEGAPDVEIVGAVDNGAQAADDAGTTQPDVVLMDLSMPDMDGVEATAAVLARCPDVRVVVLTAFAENARILAALNAGAVGYLLKDSDPNDVIRAVRDAAAGLAPISPRAARALLPGRAATPHSSLADKLSVREREVLGLVAEGLPNKIIARRLQISEKTVKTHLTRVFATLQVQDRTSAALWAQRHGLV